MVDEVRKTGTKKMRDAWNAAFDASPKVDRAAINNAKLPKHLQEPLNLPSDGLNSNSKFFKEPKYVDIPDINPEAVKDAEKAVEESGMLSKLGKYAGLAGKLGLGGIAALGALGAGNKAMAGDFTGAAKDAVDLGTDLMPGVGEAKLAYNLGKKALGVEGVGKSDNVNGIKPFDVTPYAAVNDSKMDTTNLPHKNMSEPEQEYPEAPARYNDLMKRLQNRGN